MTALNSEGLEKLKPCPFCGGAVSMEKTVDGRKWWGVVCRNTINRGGTCAIEQRPSASPEAAIERWNRRALPPVYGLEVVAYAYVVEGECEQIEWGSDVLLPDDPSLVELTPLSQDSSVIAGLRSERITAERDALEAYRKLQAAEDCISSLEQANEALMRERTSLIETKREQIGRLTAERDEAWSARNENAKLKGQRDAALPRISSLEEENKRLRKALGKLTHLYESDFDPEVTARPDWLVCALEDHNG